MHTITHPVLLLLSMAVAFQVAAPASSSAGLEQRRQAVMHYEKGLQAKREGYYQKAQTHFSSASRLDPNWGAPHLELAVVLRTTAAELSTRAPVVAKIKALLPKNPRALYESALFELRTGHKRTAVELLQRAVARRRDYLNAYIRLAQTLEELKEYKRALAHYQTILESNPAHAGALHGVAQCAQHLKDHDEEEVALLRLVRLAPTNPMGYLRMAHFYTRVGQLERADEFKAIAASLSKREQPRKMRPLHKSIR